jgi:hypothetical protein
LADSATKICRDYDRQLNRNLGIKSAMDREKLLKRIWIDPRRCMKLKPWKRKTLPTSCGLWSRTGFGFTIGIESLQNRATLNT